MSSFLLGNRSDKALLILTQPTIPGYSCVKMMMNFFGQSKFEVIARSLGFGDTDQSQIYVFEGGTKKHFSCIAVMQIRPTVKGHTWNQAMGKRVSNKIFNMYSRALGVCLNPDTLCNITVKWVKTDETVVERKTVCELEYYSPFTCLFFLINL